MPDPLPIAPPAACDPPLAAIPRRSLLWRTVLLYAAAALLSLGGAIWAMGILHADLHVPFDYEGDAVFSTTLIKTVIDKGWYWRNNDLGVPAGMMLYDFPAGDNIVCVIIKAMSLFSSDAVFLVNLFYLATFPLIALSALFTVRRFGISAGPALLVSFLYALLPYHFFRGTAHLFFSAYFLVPPTVLVVWWVSSGALLARRWRIWFSLAMCGLLGCSVPYYPFFTCFFLVLAATLALLWRRDSAHAVAAGVMIGLIVLVMLLNLLPAMLYIHEHGRAASGKRYSFESELAGLKIAQLLLPVTGHRIPAFAGLKANYNRTHPLINENDWVSLGFIGGAGFLALMGWVLFIRRKQTAAPTETEFGAVMEHFSVFNGASVLLATVGGFSALFAVLISPQIRAFNRISTFIAFFSLLAVAMGLEWIARRWVHTRAAAVGFAAAVALLGLIGLLDQTGEDAHHDWLALKRSFRNDKQFFVRVQNVLPRGALIFQLPYEPYPEYGLMMNQMSEYALFRPYLHTHGLRWSYGVIKGRPGDYWESDTAAQAPAQLLKTLNHAGFSAIYIDRFGYADHAAELEGQLRELLGTDPLVDAKGRLSLFKLPPPVSPPPPLEAILPLMPPTWPKGFYNLEGSADGQTTWRWCAAAGELRLVNDTHTTRRVRLEALLRGGTGEPSTLQISGAGLKETLTISAAGTQFSRVVTLPPGTTTVRFHCNAEPLPTNAGDPRTLVWRIDDFKFENAE